MNLDVILSERLAILGGTGSGKSYAARGLAERILARGDRLGVIDPTGVWWGVRSEFPVVLFGGDHADLPLTEHAGRVVAQAVAASQQSWIIDTSALQTKAAERRFMLDFLDSLFAANRAPITLIVDEADRFSPQRMSPETTRLHERMEEIVRRGRVRGFTPWLITQRPASLNKDVLSQATALICMRMTGAQDRSAIGDVIEGQADKPTAKAIIDAMPRHKVGEGIVWAPMQGILAPAKFPHIKTFDSMSADTAHKNVVHRLQAIDVGLLKEKLADVEIETKANDPAALKKRIRELEAEVARKPAPIATTPSLGVLQAEYERGFADGCVLFHKNLREQIDAFVEASIAAGREFAKRLDQQFQWVDIPRTPRGGSPIPPATNPATRSAPPPPRQPSGPTAEGLSGPEQRILDALAWWRAVGIDRPSKVQVAVVARYSPSGGAFNNPLGSLRSKGMIDHLSLTSAGAAVANNPGAPPTNAELHARAFALLDGPQQRILRPLIDAYPSTIEKAALAAAAGYAPDGGAFNNPLGSLRSLGFIDYPRRGQVVALPILFVE